MASFTKTDEALVKPGCCICPFVEKTHFTCYKEVINDSERKQETKDLKNILICAVKSGLYEKRQLHDEKNKELMHALYPNAQSEAKHWPLTFEYFHSGESSDVVSRAYAKSPVSGLNGICYDTVQRTRKGEDAEETIFRMFCAMLKEKKIPSFVVLDYKWNKQSYPWELDKTCKTYKFDKDKWEQIKKKGGQLDILISLPGKCLLSIEVKGLSLESDSELRVILEAFGQCKKALTFISILNNDLFYDKNIPFIPFIKTVAVPNCSRDDLGREPICENCSKHIITRDELKTVEEVYKWFSAIMKDLQSNQTSSDFDGDLYEKMMDRLLRPISLKNKTSKLMTASEQITKEHGTVEKVRSRWIQFNKEQADVIMGNHNLLWITGEPGSGKTLLVWKQIEDLLNYHDEGDNGTENFKVIALPGNKSDFLYNKYEQQLPQSSQAGNLVIQKFWEDYTMYKINTCNVLPKIIHGFQKKHRERVLHIFIDEATFLLKGTDWSEFEKDWKKLDLERLGFVWVIQNPLYTDGSELKEQIPDELDFKKVHLEYVMRMCKENVKFVSHVLDRPTLISGHGVAGHMPELYRMACVCTVRKWSVHCEKCIHERQALLIVKILKDLKESCEGTKKRKTSTSDIVIFIKDTQEFLLSDVLEKCNRKFPDRQYDAIKITNSSSFRGCEEKIVIVDLLEPSLDVKNLMESMTRCLARLILMDTGRSYLFFYPNTLDFARKRSYDFNKNENKYEDVKLIISDAVDEGLAVTKEVNLKDFDKEELEVIFN